MILLITIVYVQPVDWWMERIHIPLGQPGPC